MDKQNKQPASGKKSNNFIIQGSILAIASILVRLIGIVYRVPLTNILGPQGNGIYTGAYEIYSILLLLSSYSLPLAVSKLVSATIAKGQYKNAARYFSRAFLFAAAVGLIVSLFTFFTADFLAGTLMKSPLSAYALKVLSPAIFLVALMGTFRGYFQGLGSTVPTAISQIIEGIVHAVVAVVGAKLLFDVGMASANPEELSIAYGAAGATIGTVLGGLFGLLFLALIYWMYRRVAKRAMRRDKTGVIDTNIEIYRLLIVTIVPVILSTAVYNISNVLDQGIFNNLMLLQGFSLKEYNSMYGDFSSKYRLLTNVPIAISSALAASTVPSITANRVAKKYTEMRTKIGDGIRFTMTLTIPCAVGLTVLAEPVLSLLFRTDNTLAASMLRVGSISVVLYALSTLSNGILQGIDRMRIPVRNALISLFLHLILLVVLLQVFHMGIYAVVFANIFFSALMCYLNARAIRKESGYIQEIKKTFVLPSAAALIMGAFAYASNKLFCLILPGKLSVILALVIAVLVYFVVLIKIGGVDEEELRAFPKGGLLVKAAKGMHLL